MSAHSPIPADGLALRWGTWDGGHEETFSLAWENEGWTATGVVGRERAQYVLRLSPLWSVRQFLLFRDLDDPDLWLACDGGGRWGEVNGAHRADLDGCVDISLECTPFTPTMPIRRLPLEVGDHADVLVAAVDVETLAVVRERHRYERVGERLWRRARDGSADADTFEVDEYGLVVGHAGAFRRTG